MVGVAGVGDGRSRRPGGGGGVDLGIKKGVAGVGDLLWG